MGRGALWGGTEWVRKWGHVDWLVSTHEEDIKWVLSLPGEVSERERENVPTLGSVRFREREDNTVYVFCEASIYFPFVQEENPCRVLQWTPQP